MPHPPHEKVRFTKREIVPLHEMPSAQAHDPIIVNAHHGRVYNYWRNHLKLLAFIVFGLSATIAGLLFMIDNGLADGLVKDRARAALVQALGENYQTDLGSAGVRLTARGQFAFLARDVAVSPLSDGLRAYHADSIRLVVEPVALLSGRIEVISMEVAGATSAAADAGFGFDDLANFRVDSLNDRIEKAFSDLNKLAGDLSNRGTRTIRLSDIQFAGADDAPGMLVETADLNSAADGTFEMAALLSLGEQSFKVDVKAMRSGNSGELDRITGKVEGLKVDYRTEGLDVRTSGISTTLDLSLRAKRAGKQSAPELRVSMIGAPGTMTMGGVSAELRQINVAMAYLANKKKIEILPSSVRIADTVLPFNGGLIDIENFPGYAGARATGRGLAFDLVIPKGIAAPGDSRDAPVEFDAKALGRILPDRNRLVFDELLIATGSDAMQASLSFGFVEGKSPEINLYASTQSMPTTVVKQLWPYWLGKKVRQWVLNNLYGGTLSNASIRFSVPAGFYPPGQEAAPFKDNQFQADFDFERARMNVAGDIPPLRDTEGHVELRGDRVSIMLKSGRAYFPTGRSVDIAEGAFVIPATDANPLMAELDLSVSGKADAVAELITYHPIKVLDRIGLEPQQLSGEVASRVHARFGIIGEQNPPEPDWRAEIDLLGVDVAEPVDGRMLSALEGRLLVTPVRAELKSDAIIDGVALELDIVEPVSGSDVKRQRIITGTLDDKARDKLAPGVNLLLSGPVGLRLEEISSTVSEVSLKLDSARLEIPGIGWSKGKGIAGKASFELITNGKNQKLKDFSVSGKGFQIAGAIDLNGGAFSRAKLSKVQLSPGDDYSAEITRSGKTYNIQVKGSSADMRPLITEAKSSAAAGGSGRGEDYVIAASGNIASVRGFYDTRLSSAQFSYAGRNGNTEKMSFKAVAPSGQAVVMEVDGQTGGNEQIEMTAGDAGAFARFTGIYGKMKSGLLNVRLNKAGNGPRKGVVDIRNFTIEGEEKLNALVSSPTGSDGRSLNDAFRKNFNVKAPRFDVANARIESGKGFLNVDEGILRGTEIGASFRGSIYDPNDQMDLTGTFMPGYGINRLFGELPIIGALLGNGRDQGLIGITFRMQGPTKSPRVDINPLSAIAPGVFRSIFEFR